MEEVINSFLEKDCGKRTLGIPLLRWKSNYKMYLR
jgi:hypothetical protein